MGAAHEQPRGWPAVCAAKVVADARAGCISLTHAEPITWAAGAASAAGAPSGFSLLPCAPLRASPHWATTSPTAAASLLATDAEGEKASDGPLSAGLFALGCRHLWFASHTPYTALRHKRHDRRDLVEDTVRIAGLLPPTASQQQQQQRHGESKPEPMPDAAGVAHIGADAAGAAERLRHARRLAAEMAANQQAGWWGLRLFAYGLSWLYRFVCGTEVYVDKAGLDRLSKLAGDHQYVYIPTHKSHVDYLTLSYVLFAAGLECPHIAAGENLNLPGVGSLLAHGGAFFIRRSTRNAPDSELYKRVLAAYVHAVLANGHALEFFIEGGRSRDGAIQTPRLGLLAMVVAAVLEGQLPKSVMVVPTTISYDSPLEETSMLREVAGQPKSRENLGAVLRAAGCVLWGLLTGRTPDARSLGCGGRSGCVSISFGEPLSIKRFLKDKAKTKRKRRSGTKGGADAAAGASAAALAGKGGGSNGSGDDDRDEIDSLLAGLQQQYDVSAGGKQQQGNGSAKPAANGSAQPSADGSKSLAASLLEVFPEGSAARRHAVEALGKQVHARMRAANVLPATTLLVIGLQHAADLASGTKISRSSRSAAMGDQEGPAGERLYAEGPWVAIEDVMRSVEWLEDELRWRGAKFMSLAGAVNQDQVVAHMARVMGGCMRAQLVGGRVSALRSLGGPHAVLVTQYRRNQLLPLFLEEGMAACAVASVGHRRLRSSSSSSNCVAPGSGAPRVDRAGTARSHCRRVWVPEEEVACAALWLRRLLGGAADTAVGEGGAASTGAMVGVLRRMEADGSLVVKPDAAASGSAFEQQQQQRLVRLPRSGPGAATSSFAAGLLAPLLATHACVADVAGAAIRSAPGGRMRTKDLLQQVQQALAQPPSPTSGGGQPQQQPPPQQQLGKQGREALRSGGGALPCSPLPSVMVHQAALEGLQRGGYLQPEQAGDTPTGALRRHNFMISVQSTPNLVSLAPQRSLEGGKSGSAGNGVSPSAVSGASPTAAGAAVAANGPAAPEPTAARANGHAAPSPAPQAVAEARTIGGLSGPKDEVLVLGDAWETPEQHASFVERVMSFVVLQR